jgi:tetratricopeptide (TPR) repeat protein
MNNLADAYIAADRKDEALKLREDALAIATKQDPDSWASVTAHAQVGFTLIALGRGDEAIKAWQEAVRSNPADTQTAKLLATVYLWLGQTNEHQAICRKLFDLAAHSKDPVVHDCAAKAYFIQAHPDPELLKLAVASGRQALKLSTPGDINRAWFLITAAMAAVREGKPAEAEPLLTESLNLPGDTPDRQGLALAYRAMARAQLGQTDKARTDFAALEKLVLPLPARKSLSAALLSDNHLAACIAYEEAEARLDAPRAPHP